MTFLIIILSLFFFFIGLKNFKLALGLTIFCLPLYLLKIDFWGLKNVLEVLILVCVFVFIIKILKKQIKLSQFYFLKNYFWPLLLLFIALIISILISEDKIRSLGVFKAWFLLPVIFGVIAGSVIEKKKDFLNLVYFFISSALILSFYGIWQFLTGKTLIDGRVGAIFESANYLAMFLGLALSFVFLINPALPHQNFWRGSKSIIIFGIILITFLLARSEAAFLGIILAILFAYLLKYKKISVDLVILILILVLLAEVFIPNLFYEKIKNAERNSFSSRLQIWYVSSKILKENPFLGIGLGCFEAIYQKYLPYYFFPPLEWLAPEPHNLFLAFWLQTGILGLMAFFLILRKVLKNIQNFISKKENFVLFGILVALLFVVFQGVIDTPYWKNDFAIVFWFLVFGAEALILKNKKAA